MGKSRIGADYYAAPRSNPNNTPWLQGWERRTSTGWLPVARPRGYHTASASQHMRLGMRPGMCLVAGVIAPGGVWLVRDEFPLSDSVQVIAMGPKRELWDLFLAHGDMITTGG